MTLSYSKLFMKYLQDYLLLLQALVILEMRYINRLQLSLIDSIYLVTLTLILI